MKTKYAIQFYIVLSLIACGCAGFQNNHNPQRQVSVVDPHGKKIVLLSTDVLKDKIKGGWAGQVIGCTFGGDTEFTHKGTFIQDYQSIPWQPGYIQHIFMNRPGLYDDIYMDISFLKVFFNEGLDASARQLAEEFAHADFPLWHANQAARYNILNGIYPPASGHWKNNPHADDIDFQIEADFIGLIAPGMLQTVAQLSDRVGHIMNYGDGWYGGLYVASMVSMAFITQDIEEVVVEALKNIPPESDFYRCIKDVINWHAQFPHDWKRTWFEIQRKWAQEHGCPDGVMHPFNIDAKVNAAYVVTGLLYGKGDYTRTLEIATRCGQDSDCNPATAGGILGVIKGYSGLPEKYVKDLKPVENLPFKYTDMSLEDAYNQSLELAYKLISRNGGYSKDGQVQINFQEPKAVRFEKGWEGHYPSLRLWINKPLESDYSLSFRGNGIAVRGWADKKDNSTPDKVLILRVFQDGKDLGLIRLPTDEIRRRNELFWKYGLEVGEHEITLEWLNPDPMYEIKVIEAVIYSDRPYTFN